MPESKKIPAHDDFVSKVVKDPKQPPDAQLLTGFVGKSSEEGYTRFYTDANLRDFVDIPDSAILHSEKVAPEHSPLGGSHVWIDRNAEVIYGTVGPQRTRAKFFEGPIAAQAAAGAGPALPPSPFPAQCLQPTATCPMTPVVPCPTHPGVNCPPSPPPLLCPATHLPPCPISQIAPCPPSPPPLFCHSPLPQCPPSPPPLFCHSPLPQCPPSPPPLFCHSPLPQCPQPTLLPHLCPTPVQICPTPTCPSHPLVCPQPTTHPQLCPPTTHPQLCPPATVLPHLCLTPTVLQHCPTQLCPSVHIPCLTALNCPVVSAACPVNPGGGGVLG